MRSLIKNGEIREHTMMFWLFDATGNPAWSNQFREMSMKECKKIFKAWQDWSGFEVGKFYGHGK